MIAVQPCPVNIRKDQLDLSFHILAPFLHKESYQKNACAENQLIAFSASELLNEKSCRFRQLSALK
jgi:hypothetical protein